MRAAPLRALAVLAALVVAACATLPEGPGRVAVLGDTSFVAVGRLSARHARDAASVSYRWNHAPPADQLELSTPLGQTVAVLSGDSVAKRAMVRLADGRMMEAASWAELTERALGFPLPVSGLASWIRGGAHEGSAAAGETDAAGRATLLRQDGWEIVFDYADDAARTPNRLRMSYPGVEVRIVVERLDAR